MFLQSNELSNLPDKPFQSLLERNASQKMAVIEPNRRWTYRDLIKSIRNLSEFLRDQNVGIGSRVCLCLENSSAFTITAASSFYLKSILLPVYARMGALDFLHTLKTAKPDIIIGLPKAATPFKLSDYERISSGRTLYRIPILRRTRRLPHLFAINKTDMPGVFFASSGTTGNPRLFYHDLRGIMGSALSFSVHSLLLRENSRIGTNAPLCWSYGFMAGFSLPLLHGLPSCLWPTRTYRSMVSNVSKLRVSTLFTSPTTLRYVMRRFDEEKLRHHFRRLKQIVTAGERLPKGLAIELKRRVPRVIVTNELGTSEVGPILSTSVNDRHPGCLGTAIHGVVVRTVRMDDAPMPCLLYIRVPTEWKSLREIVGTKLTVRRGWWNSGDIVTKDQNGHFWYAGRMDQMVKVAGYRVYPSEIEEALLLHPSVNDCVVYGVNDERLGQRIEALVELSSGARNEQERLKSIRKHLKKSLADFKWPSRILAVTKIPRTLSGKKSLREFTKSDMQTRSLRASLAGQLSEPASV